MGKDGRPREIVNRKKREKKAKERAESARLVSVMDHPEDMHKYPRRAFHAPPSLFEAIDRYLDHRKKESPGTRKLSFSEFMRAAVNEKLERVGYFIV